MQALAASCEELRARTGNPPLYVQLFQLKLSPRQQSNVQYGRLNDDGNNHRFK